MKCRRCQGEAHAGGCGQGSLLPPLEPWREELQQRVEAYRAKRARVLPGAAQGVGDAELEETAARVLEFRGSEAPRAQMRTIASAAPVGEALAEPVVLERRVREAAAPELAPQVLEAPPLPELPELALPAFPPEAGLAEPVRRRTPERQQGRLRFNALPSDVATFLPIPLPTAKPPAAAQPSPRIAVAGRQQRMQAGLADAGIVLAAAALFGLAGWASQGFEAPDAHSFRHLLPAMILVPVVLAGFYLLGCAFAGDATVGMQGAGLRVVGFDGPLTPEAQRRRGWASLISLLALGLGYAWIFCDSQKMTWHDYISHTFVTARREPEGANASGEA